MKLMICTMVFGSRSRSSPRTISCGSVVARQGEAADHAKSGLGEQRPGCEQTRGADGQSEEFRPRSESHEGQQHREDDERDFHEHPRQEMTWAAPARATTTTSRKPRYPANAAYQ